MKAIKNFLAASYNSYHQEKIDAFMSEDILTILQSQDYLTEQELYSQATKWQATHNQISYIYSTYLKISSGEGLKQQDKYQKMYHKIKQYEEAINYTKRFTVPARIALEQYDIERVFQWSKELVDSNQFFEIKDKEVLSFLVYPYVYMSYLYKQMTGHLSQYDAESLAQCKAYTQLHTKKQDVKTRYLNTLQAYINNDDDRRSTLRHFLFTSCAYKAESFAYDIETDPQLKTVAQYFKDKNSLLTDDIIKEIASKNENYLEIIQKNREFIEIMEALNYARKSMDLTKLQSEVEVLAKHAAQDTITPDNGVILNGVEKMQLVHGYRYLIIPVIKASLQEDNEAMRKVVTSVIKQGRIFMSILPDTGEHKQVFYNYAKLALLKSGYIDNEYTKEIDSWAHETNIDHDSITHIIIKQQSNTQSDMSKDLEHYIQSGKKLEKEDNFMLSFIDGDLASKLKPKKITP